MTYSNADFLELKKQNRELFELFSKCSDINVNLKESQIFPILDLRIQNTKQIIVY